MPAQQVASLFAAIGADLSGLNKGLKQAKKQIRDSSAAFRGYGDVIDVMEQKGTRLGLALSAAGGAAVALATDFAMTAGRSKELSLIMEQVGTNAGFSSDELHAAAQAVKDVNITSQTAYKTITELVWAEIELSDAVKLANAAQDAARIKGENTSQALEGLLHGIRTYNPMVLRTYGYTLDLAGAFKQEAESLGIAAEELTATQKQQITLNAVVEAGTAIAGVYEATQGTLSGSLRSSARDVMNLKEAFGKHLEPALLAIVNTGRTIIKWLTDLPEPLQAIITYGGTAAGVFAAMAGGLILIVPQLVRTYEGFNAMVVVVRSLLAPTVAATTATEALAASQVGAEVATHGLNTALATTMALLGPIILAYTAVAITLKGVDWWQNKQRKAMEDTSESYEDYIAQMKDWLEVQNAMGKGHKGAVEDMERLMGTLILTREQFKETKNALVEEGEAVQKITKVWRDYTAERKKTGPHRLYGTGTPTAPPIPIGYQEGGIVTKPTLAMLGEAGPEAVVPLGKMGGLGEPMQVIFQLPPGLMADRTALRQLAREVAMMLEKRSRGGGRQTAFSGSFS